MEQLLWAYHLPRGKEPSRSRQSSREEEKKKSRPPEATARKTSLEFGCSAARIARVHSFIQIFTKHLLSAKYHTRHHGKYREEDDVTLPLER